VEGRRAKERQASRPGDRAILLVMLGILALGASLVHATLGQSVARPHTTSAQELVRELRLTGLALFTEARYTRHPALADRFAPFQNHPAALEHFPSGSLIRPPAHLHD